MPKRSLMSPSQSTPVTEVTILAGESASYFFSSSVNCKVAPRMFHASPSKNLDQGMNILTVLLLFLTSRLV